jgi:hypothetical protein
MIEAGTRHWALAIPNPGIVRPSESPHRFEFSVLFDLGITVVVVPRSVGGAFMPLVGVIGSTLGLGDA